MHVLVTGHKGYIGTVTVPMLVQAGHAVVGLDSDFFQECTFCSGIFEVAELRVDVRDVRTGDLVIVDRGVGSIAALPSNGTVRNEV